MQVSSSLISYASSAAAKKIPTFSSPQSSAAQVVDSTRPRPASVTYIKKFSEHDYVSQVALNTYSEVESFSENGVGILAGISVYI